MTTTITHNALPKLPQASGNSAGSNAATGTPAPADSSATAIGHGDQLKLTDSARALQEAARQNDASPIDAKRVDQIRRALADGSYKIDAGRIADRMLAMDHQLGGTTRS